MARPHDDVPIPADAPEARQAQQRFRRSLTMAVLVLVVGASLTAVEFGKRRLPRPAPTTTPQQAAAPTRPAPPSRKVPMPEAVADRVAAFIEDGRAFTLGSTRAEITRNLGEPPTVETTPVENRHDKGQVDEYVVLKYDGLLVGIYHVAADDRELIEGVSITNDRYPALWGLQVGSPLARVREVLGAPDRELNGACSYADKDAPSSVTFRTQDGKVTKIEWTYYID